jgi:septum site-determining protein MinC
MNSSGIQLKGTNFGVRIVFPDELGDDALMKQFAAVPGEAYALPIGSGLVLDFQGRPCSERLVTRILREVVWPKKLNVLAWLTTDEESSVRMKMAGFRVTEPVKERTAKSAAPECVILPHSLRSGQSEERPGNVILVGHLNDGAEVFAGGSVFVLGKLKGLVHAGCGGTEGVCVVAGSFETRQLRIGDKLCDQFGSDVKWWRKPVIITVEDGALLFREWTASQQ